jgi:hypothetical protein
LENPKERREFQLSLAAAQTFGSDTHAFLKRQRHCFISQAPTVTMPSQTSGIKVTVGGIGDSEEASERGRAMKLRSQTVRAFHQSRPIVPCAQCGEALFAPEWSEYFDDRRIRHFWSCDSCDYQFETMVSYPPTDARAA